MRSIFARPFGKSHYCTSRPCPNSGGIDWTINRPVWLTDFLLLLLLFFSLVWNFTSFNLSIPITRFIHINNNGNNNNNDDFPREYWWSVIQSCYYLPYYESAPFCAFRSQASHSRITSQWPNLVPVKLKGCLNKEYNQLVSQPSSRLFLYIYLINFCW